MTGLNVNWEAIGEILALLFVISIVFETALTPIFNWRLFAKYFEGKGVKTPVTIAAAVALLWGYDIDIFKHNIDAFAAEGAAPSTSTFPGRIMTGLLVAGGSGAIFTSSPRWGCATRRSSPRRPRRRAKRLRWPGRPPRRRSNSTRKRQNVQQSRRPAHRTVNRRRTVDGGEITSPWLRTARGHNTAGRAPHVRLGKRATDGLGRCERCVWRTHADEEVARAPLASVAQPGEPGRLVDELDQDCLEGPGKKNDGAPVVEGLDNGAAYTFELRALNGIVDGRSDLRETHVGPAGRGDIVVTLPGGRTCSTDGAIAPPAVWCSRTTRRRPSGGLWGLQSRTPRPRSGPNCRTPESWWRSEAPRRSLRGGRRQPSAFEAHDGRNPCRDHRWPHRCRQTTLCPRAVSVRISKTTFVSRARFCAR